RPVHMCAVDKDHGRGVGSRERHRRTTHLGYLHDRPVLYREIRPIEVFVVHGDSTGPVLAGGECDNGTSTDRHLPDSRVAEACPIDLGSVGDNAARQNLAGNDVHGARLLTDHTGRGTGREDTRIDYKRIEPDLTKTRLRSPSAQGDRDHDEGQQHWPTYLFHTGSPFTPSSSPLGSTCDNAGALSADKT